MLSIKTILHPTDFSAHSERAFRMACMLARGYGARLVVLHVAAPPVILYCKGALPVVPEEDHDQLRERLQQLIATEPTVQAEQRLAEGDAANVILRIAQEIKCDMIVMGTHGRTGLGRLLMGSVAEHVVRSAPLSCGDRKDCAIGNRCCRRFRSGISWPNGPRREGIERSQICRRFE
jgi:nucleotide-binding universal stress UspA family protein